VYRTKLKIIIRFYLLISTLFQNKKRDKRLQDVNYKNNQKRIINVVKNIFEFEIKQKQLNMFDVALKKNVIVIAKIKFEKSLLY